MSTPSTADTSEKKAQGEPSDFAAFLLQTNKGRSHSELTKQFADLIAAVKRTGRPGSLAYKVTVKPQAGREDMVLVVDEITAKPPQSKRAESAFFVDNNNSLHRSDPRQPSMFDTH